MNEHVKVRNSSMPITWLPCRVADHDSQNLELVFSAVSLVGDSHCDGAVGVLRYPDAGQKSLALQEFVVRIDCFFSAFATRCTAVGERDGIQDYLPKNNLLKLLHTLQFPHPCVHTTSDDRSAPTLELRCPSQLAQMSTLHP